jgi:two-component system cell cycle response regulator
VADAPESWDDDTTGAGMPAEQTSAEAGTRKQACFTVITGGAAGQTFKLSSDGAREPAVIGRAADAEIRIVDDGVSRRHARVRPGGETGRLFVDDLGSRNGTYVNGVRIDGSAELHDGDKLQIGRTTVLRFAYHDRLDESFHAQLLASALRDPLTRLYNKRYLLDRLDSELKFARRHDAALSLLMLDIDHLKAINDGHGHLAGDAVLVQLAGVLQKIVRNEDVVARFGGEELAIILRASAVDAAVALGERLCRTIEATVFPYRDLELRATVSIGVVGLPAIKADTVEQLLEAADQALYRAKDAGRNRVSK